VPAPIEQEGIMKRLTSMLSVLTVTFVGLGSFASRAAAQPPLREDPFSFTFTLPDFFADTGQECAFPVVGSWDVVLAPTTFFDGATGSVDRVVTVVDFHGTLSNPLSGKSIPDASNSNRVTDYFATDGSLIKTVENESRDNSLLRAAFHIGVDAQGNVLFESGRDWIPTASHVIDIAPLCAALT
jgi:hypothetical protein